MREALAIATAGTAGFGVTLDLDALDPLDAPGVGSPATGGLRARELAAALALIAGHPALAGIEIAEYNPLHDRDGVTARLAVEMLQAMLGAPAAQAPKLAPLTLVAGNRRSKARPMRSRAEMPKAA
jgi:arginase